MVLYCDQAAAARSDDDTLDFFAETCRIAYANQEALHGAAFEIRKAMESAGCELARSLTGSDDFALCWCGSGTEAFLLLEHSGILKKRKAAASPLEHPALRAVLKRNCASIHEQKCTSSGSITVPEGDFDAVFFHSVQSELGTIQNIPELMKQLPEHCLRFTDAVQSAGKMNMYHIAEHSDIISVSGMKFGAPGGGALLIRKNRPWSSSMLKKISLMRHPEYNIARIFPPTALSCAYALQKCCDNMEQNLERIKNLNSFLRRELCHPGIIFTVPEHLSSPYILHLYLPGKQGGVVVRMLSDRQIFAGSGSACAAESNSGSAAMRAIGYSSKESFSGLRLSFGFDFSMEQAEFLVKNLLEVLKNY